MSFSVVIARYPNPDSYRTRTMNQHGSNRHCAARSDVASHEEHGFLSMDRDAALAMTGLFTAERSVR